MPEGQRRILEAAIAAFAEKGFAATSTAEIARKAEVAEGLIFKHFKTKKDLFLRIAFPIIIKFLFPLSIQRVKKVIQRDHDDVAAMLTELFHERLQFIQQHRTLARMLIQELWLHPEIQPFLATQFKQQLLPEFITWVEKYQKQGLLRKLPPSTIVRAIISAFVGYLIPRVLMFPEGDWQDDIEGQHIVSLLLQGLQTGEQNDGPP